MTNEQFDELFETDDMYNKYMEFIMENADGEWPICNGDDVIEAAEAFYLFEEFREHWIAAIEQDARDWDAEADRNDYEKQFA
jgi:hypothetical protein